MQFGLRLKF